MTATGSCTAYLAAWTGLALANGAARATCSPLECGYPDEVWGIRLSGDGWTIRVWTNGRLAACDLAAQAWQARADVPPASVPAVVATWIRRLAAEAGKHV